jgi:hypothetical protein
VFHNCFHRVRQHINSYKLNVHIKSHSRIKVKPQHIWPKCKIPWSTTESNYLNLKYITVIFNIHYSEINIMVKRWQMSQNNLALLISYYTELLSDRQASASWYCKKQCHRTMIRQGISMIKVMYWNKFNSSLK